MRGVPRVGDVAHVVRLADTTAAVITAVDGHSVTVDCGGERLVFDLHPKTAQFVLRGEPSYGTRLRVGH